MRTSLAKFGRFLSDKHNFVRYSLVAIGVPASIWMSWSYFVYFSDRSVVLLLFMIGLALLASYGWGVLMWKFLFGRHRKSGQRRADT
jgi:hypothetical protein